MRHTHGETLICTTNDTDCDPSFIQSVLQIMWEYVGIHSQVINSTRPFSCPLSSRRRRRRGDECPNTAARSAARSGTLAFAVMEGEAAPDTDQSRAQKAAVKIQRMHRQNSSSSKDADEKARRQWIKFHLENGQYEEALALGWDGDLEKNAQAPTLDGDAEDAGGATSDAADVGTGDWSEEHAAASSKIAAVRKGSLARKERDAQKKSAVAIQSRFRNRHSRVKSEGGSERQNAESETRGETHAHSRARAQSLTRARAHRVPTVGRRRRRKRRRQQRQRIQTKSRQKYKRR